MPSVSTRRCSHSPRTITTSPAQWRWRAATRKAKSSAVRYVRDGFFAARQFADVDDLNAQAATWCAGAMADRPCPQQQTLSVRAAFAEEMLRLIALPDNAYPLNERGGCRCALDHGAHQSAL